MTPQERAKRLAGCEKIDGLFGRAPLLALVDHRLESTDVHILSLIAFASRYSGAASIGFNELAWASNSSRRTVIRSIKTLNLLGYISVEKAHNRRNTYRINGLRSSLSQPQVHVDAIDVIAKKVKPTVLCPTCGKMRYGLLRAGYCRACNWKRNVRAVFHEEMAATA